MDPEISISPQYLQKQPIEVTILKIINPAHFIVKETPRKCMSKEAKQFLALEDKITHYYDSFEPIFSQLPTKGSIVIVQPGGSKQKWFRARVSSILDSTKGPCVSAYLVDYGRICTVTRNCIYTVCEDFLNVPFQAVEFKLPGLKPAGYSLNLDMTLKFGLVSKWDISAEEHVSNVWKEMTNAQIEILGFDQGGCLYGNLNIQQGDHSFCLNQQLLKDEYAVLLHDEYPKVFSVEEILNARCQDNVQNTPQGLRCESNDITLDIRAIMEKESKKQLKEKLESFREKLRQRENEDRCENKSCSTSVTDDKFRKLLHLIKPKASANSSDTKELRKQNIVSIEKEINDIKEMPGSSAMQNTSDSGQAFSSKNKSPHMPRLSLSEHSKVSFHNINQVPMCDNANIHILNKQTINRNGFARTTLENSKPLVQQSIQNINSLTEQITAYGLKENENGNNFLECYGLQSSSLPLKNIISGTTSENHIKKSVTLDKFAMLKKQIYSKPLCPQTKVSYHNMEILCDETLPKVEEQSSNESIVSSLTSKDSFLKLVKEKTAETNLVLSELPNSNSVPTVQMKSVNICSQKNEMRNINENLILLRDTVEQNSEKRDLKRHSISSNNHIQANQSSFCNSSDVPELVIPEILPYSVSKSSAPSRSKSETMTSPADPFKKLQRLVKGKSIGRKITSENTISKLDSPGVQSNSNSASYTSYTNISPKNEKSKKPDQDALFEECKWPEKVTPEIWLNASCKNQLQMNQQGNQPVLCNSSSMPKSLPLVKMPDTSSDSILLSNHDLSELNSVPAKDQAQENINSANMCSITEMKEADQVAFKLNDPEDLLEGVVQKNKFEEQNKVLSDASNVSYTLLNSETSEQSDVEKKQEIKYPFNGINIDAQERISLEEFYDENIGTAFFKTNLVL